MLLVFFLKSADLKNSFCNQIVVEALVELNIFLNSSDCQ